MLIQEALLPVFVLVGLTFFLMFWMGFARVGVLKRREIRMGDIALGQPAWPPRVMQISNAYHNQFQMPVLFYALVAFALITRKADLIFVLMAWIFVLCRLAHAAIHVTTNRVPVRFYAFLASAVVLLLMWLIFAVRILVAI
jgi:hypothetical protein